jgi:hypothetical protein
MSEYVNELKAVQQKIENLLKKETRLKKKKELTEEEEIDLEGVAKLLTVLQGQEKYWREEVSKENKPEEISKSFGEADLHWIASVTGINCEYREWTAFASEVDQTVIPSPGFQQAYEKVSKYWHMLTEAGRRIFLNLFLSEVVSLPEFKETLRIFPEIQMSVESKGPKKRRLNGKTDYTVGFSNNMGTTDNTPPRELHLVAIEAKASIGDTDLWQCVAETATLYRSRKDAGKANCAVWGVLSNATDWIFIHIDKHGKLWQTEKYILNIHQYKQNQVKAIYQALHYVVKCCYESCTPNPTPASSSSRLNE